MAKIIIPSPLRKFTGQSSTITTNATTVENAIIDLTQQHSDLTKHILDEKGKIRSFIRIYVGDEDITALDDEKTVVSNEAVISIVPAIAGGSF